MADFITNSEASSDKLLVLEGDRHQVNRSGRISDGAEYHLDYVIESGTINHKFFMQIDLVSLAVEERYSVLTQLEFYGNEFTTKERLNLSDEASLKDFVLEECAKAFIKTPTTIKVAGNKPARARGAIQLAAGPAAVEVRAVVKRMGVVKAEEVAHFNIGALVVQVAVDNDFEGSKNFPSFR